MYLGMGPGKDRKKGGRKGYPETVMRGLAGTFTTLATLPSASASPLLERPASTHGLWSRA